jgi:hypothetical protein
MPDHKENYKRQGKGLAFLKSEMPGFYCPTKQEKKEILQMLGISKRFQQTFDAIRMKVPTFADIKSAKDFDLVEIKATDKHLPNLPQGFFFGMTENEEMLLKVFEDKYFLCLVCLNKKSPGFKIVGWTELKDLIRHKRVQYQINLISKAKAAGIE